MFKKLFNVKYILMKCFESVESVLMISGTHLWKCSVVKSGPCMIPCEAAPCHVRGVHATTRDSAVVSQPRRPVRASGPGEPLTGARSSPCTPDLGQCLVSSWPQRTGFNTLCSPVSLCVPGTLNLSSEGMRRICLVFESLY